MRKIVCIVLLFLFSTSYASLNKDLILAVSRGKFADVQKLIGKGASIQTRYDKGKTPLHWAVLSGQLKIAAYLISLGADVNARDANGATPLHASAIRKDLDMVKLLVLKGADVNAKDRYGWTPLHYYTFYEDSLMVKYIIIQEADISVKTSKKYMDIPENSTALDIAVKKDFSNIILTLQHPDKYSILAKKPVLMANASLHLGFTNMLIAPGKAIIAVSVENKGGGNAGNVNVTVDKVSNCDGLIIGTGGTMNLFPNQRGDWTIPIETGEIKKKTTAVLSVSAHETNFGRSSGPVVVEIPLLPPQPPKLNLSSLFEASPDRALHALEKGRIIATLENQGLGSASQTRIRVEALSNCEAIRFTAQENITLEPREKKVFYLPVEPSQDLGDGNAAFYVIAEDLKMPDAATNLFVINTRRVLKPLFQAVPEVTDASRDVPVTNFITNELERYMTIATNISHTNENYREFHIILKNSGEGAAKNVRVTARFLAANGIEVALNDNQKAVLFTIQDMPPGTMATLKLPFVLKDFTAEGTINWELSGADERNLCPINVNIPFDLKRK